MTEVDSSSTHDGCGNGTGDEAADMVETLAAFFRRESADDLPPQRALGWRVGEAAREIIERLVDTRATESDLEAVAVDLEAAAARLSQFEHGRRYDGYGEAATAGGGPPLGHADFSPLIGRANPIAPPMEFTLDPPDGSGPTSVRADVTFGSAYEGPPGCVHGGLVAAAFDEVMGATQALSGSPGMTGTLEVVYRAPTPLRTPLIFRAWLESVEGRKITVLATLHADLGGDEPALCAEATGIFISVDFERLRALQAERDAGQH